MPHIQFLDVIAAGDLTADCTSEVQVSRLGTFNHPRYGRITLTEETVREMVGNFEARRDAEGHLVPLVVDYQHQSLADDPERAIAAGWVHELIDRGPGGLWARVQWTERAALFIENGEYRYISPEIAFDAVNKETGQPQGVTLLAVALTNRPFFEGMAPVVLCAEAADHAVWVEPAAGAPETPLRNAASPIPLPAGGEEPLASPPLSPLPACASGASAGEGPGVGSSFSESHLRGLLGLDEEADIPRALADLSAGAGEAAELRERIGGMERDRLVTDAIAEGKLPPALGEWARGYAFGDPEGFRAFLAGQTPNLLFAELGAGDAPDADDSAEERLVRLAERVASARGMGFREAAAEVLKGDPALARAYEQEVGC